MMLLNRFALLGALGCIATTVLAVEQPTISLQQLNHDVTYLASDQLQGRKVFSPGIDQAADYIAHRFKEIGLKPFAANQDFKQTFTLYALTPESAQFDSETLKLDASNILTLGAYQRLDWNQSHSVKTLHIGANDNLQQSLMTLNQAAQDTLVTVDPSHAKTFAQMKGYFERGQNNFSLNQGPSAVLLLTDKTLPDNYHLVASNRVEKHQLSNLVGVLPGKSSATEMVLFSAHYDHLGTHEQADSKNADAKVDTVFNGADDDASGTSAVINLAQYFAARHDNERTLVFVAFTAEEIGGYGSRYFSEQLDPRQVVAMINIEMIGKPSKFGAGHVWMTGYERSNLASILNRDLEADQQIQPDPYPDYHLFYRSDNATLARLGVPAHSFSSTQIDKDPYYHQLSDQVETLDINSMHQVITTLAEAVKPLVSSRETPSRIDTSQVTAKGAFF